MQMMDFMFRGGGVFYGLILVCIIPLAIFFGVKFARRLTALNNRGVKKDESKAAKIGDQSLQSKIMTLALHNKGVLTVSDVVIATGLSVKQTEETLNSMVDSYRVKMEVKDSGIVVYEFAELIK